MADNAELQSQLITVLEEADYPVSSPVELIPVLPEGPHTTFETNSSAMTAMEIYSEVSPGDFPYEDVDTLVEDVIQELESVD